MSIKPALHQPIMVQEALSFLQPETGKWIVDATFGRGGHTRNLLEAGSNVLALDWDHEAIEYGQEVFTEYLAQGQLKLAHASFAELYQVVTAEQLTGKISGILFDFGTSVDQLTNAERGFSFHDEGDLDMRMDIRLGVTAKDLLAIIPEAQLKHLFQEMGGEEEAGAVARAIDKARKSGHPITTTAELVDIITRAKRKQSGHLHPATKVFQALRIAVNSELTAIEEALPQAAQVLTDGKGGTLVTIAFHEGEDRLVKTAFAKWETQNKGKVLTPKVITPSQEEIQNNSRSRSAKLRAIELYEN